MSGKQISFGLMGMVAAALLAAWQVPAQADVKPAALFSDHMVLQQSVSAPVWGWASPGEKVTVSFEAQHESAIADANGKWLVRIQTPKAGGPYSMTVSAPSGTAKIDDILVGEVWLASGQSNMDFTISNNPKTFAGVQNMDQEIAAANFPQVRMFTADLKMADTPQTDVTGHWAVCSPQTVGQMSAVAYFFARDLNQAEKIPFGIVDSTWGGSSAQCWISRDALESDPVA